MASVPEPTPENQAGPVEWPDLIHLLLEGHASLAFWARHLCLLVQPMAKVLGGKRIETCLDRIWRYERFHPSVNSSSKQQDYVDPAQ